MTKRYGSVTALSGVSFSVPDGSVTGLLGRNGAGKTTALNLMTGYFPPNRGRVTVDGMDMTDRPRECKRMIGYLPERPPLYDEMTVDEYLRFVSRLREVKPRAVRAHVDEIVRLCGLEEMRSRLLGHLSRGYRQRAGIAQALCGSPPVLIFDEPTVGLDPKQVTEIRSLIRVLGGSHTVLFSSHILSEVQQLCSTAIILHEGRIVRTVSPGKAETDETEVKLRLEARAGESELLSTVSRWPFVRSAETVKSDTPGISAVRIDCRNEKPDPAEKVSELLHEAGIPLRMLAPEKDTLEEIFLAATADT